MMMQGQQLLVTRRLVLGALAIVSTNTTWPAMAMSGLDAKVYRTSGCSCCLAWVRHLERAGFKATTTDLTMGQLMRMKLDAGLTDELASCHTAKIDEYTIEGHVPIQDVQRLLQQKPEAAGLAVPGMPIGSPGMESGNRRDAFDVLLFRKGGTTEVYASYDAKS